MDETSRQSVVHEQASDAYMQRELLRLANQGVRQSTAVAAATMPLGWLTEWALHEHGFGSADLGMAALRVGAIVLIMLLAHGYVRLRRDEVAHPFALGTVLMWLIALLGGLSAAHTGGYDSAYAVAAVPILVVWTLLMPGGARFAVAPLVGGFLVYEAALYFVAPPSPTVGKSIAITVFQGASVVVAMVFCEILENFRRRVLVASSNDALTGLLSRGYILARLDHLAAKRKRHPADVCAILIDLDHFKRVNDEHGHAAGDVVLKRVADIIRGVTREEDLTGRIGGEEFLLVLDECDETQGREVAERLRETLEQTPIEVPGAVLHTTLSAGVTCAGPFELYSPEVLVRSADAALYEAKEAGRNRVHVGELRPSLT